ncbi:neurofilament heavy polypeptide-like [Leptidea sinapis]|uniref:neurofilament heavy polypeptide-like n=1 Tax=Leptidea sinapis TaxID=189913 RepID=UPI0021C3EDAD|nr:neurofilament heavy polypeptide-like [Leptidea sinapis]
MEASQQRQESQDSHRPYTNGTVLLNSGPVHIVTSEYQEKAKEEISALQKAKNVLERKENTDDTNESIKNQELTQNDLTPIQEETPVQINQSNTILCNDHTDVTILDEPSIQTDSQQTSELHISSYETPRPEEISSFENKQDRIENHSDSSQIPIDPSLENIKPSQLLEESVQDLADRVKEISPEAGKFEQGPTDDFSDSDLNQSFIVEEKESQFVAPSPPIELTESPVDPSIVVDREQTNQQSEQNVTQKAKPEQTADTSLERDEVFTELQESHTESTLSETESLQASHKQQPTDTFITQISVDDLPELIDLQSEDLDIKAEQRESSMEREKPSSGLDYEDIQSEDLDIKTEHRESSMEREKPISGLDYDLIENFAVDSKESPPVPIYDTTQSKEYTQELIESLSDKQMNDMDEPVHTLDEIKADSDNKKRSSDENFLEESKEFKSENSDEEVINEDNITAMNSLLKPESLTKSSDDFLKQEKESCDKEGPTTPELLAEAMKEDSPKEEAIDSDSSSVKVLGMEMTAHPADGSAWPRTQPSLAPTPPAAPHKEIHKAEDVKSIYLETEIPQQSRVLVAEFAEDSGNFKPTRSSPLVVSGKMTLSLIQDVPRDTPERELESTFDEFTTASAVTQPAAQESDEDLEEEIEVEEIEEEIEEDEETDEDEEDVKNTRK